MGAVLPQRGFALKTGRREVPGSIPGLACRPSRSEFSVVSPLGEKFFTVGYLRNNHIKIHKTNS